jgi:hypothetical protein
MASSLDLTAASAVVKTLFPPSKVARMTYESHPLLALVEKDENFEGDGLKIPLQYGNPQGRATILSTAQTNKTSSKYAAFTITRASDYAVASISNEAIRASKSNEGAFVRLAKREIDSALKALIGSLASAMYRSGTGSIGKISAISTGVITLTDPESVTQFDYDQKLTAHATDGGTARADAGYVIAVDRGAGTVTVSATRGGSAGTPTNWAANDFICVDGDLNAKIKGLAAWIPSTAPTSTAFFGVDRSVDVTRLGGVRFTGTSYSIEEARVRAAARAGREGGFPRHAFVSFGSWAALEASLSGRVQYVDIEGKGEAAGIGFKAIRVNGPKGPIDVIADGDCPGQTAYLLDMNTWKLHSLDKAPHIAEDDGLTMLREASADNCEVRCRYWAQLACDAPGFNAVVSLSA